MVENRQLDRFTLAVRLTNFQQVSTVTAATIFHCFAKTRMRFSTFMETSCEMKFRSLTQLLALLKSCP